MIKRIRDESAKQLRLYDDEGFENRATTGKQNIPVSYWLLYIRYFKGDKIMKKGSAINMGYTLYEWRIE